MSSDKTVDNIDLEFVALEKKKSIPPRRNDKKRGRMSDFNRSSRNFNELETIEVLSDLEEAQIRAEQKERRRAPAGSRASFSGDFSTTITVQSSILQADDIKTEEDVVLEALDSDLPPSPPKENRNWKIMMEELTKNAVHMEIFPIVQEEAQEDVAAPEPKRAKIEERNEQIIVPQVPVTIESALIVAQPENNQEQNLLVFSPDWNARPLDKWAESIDKSFCPSKFKKAVAIGCGVGLLGAGVYAVTAHPEMVADSICQVQHVWTNVAVPYSQLAIDYATKRVSAIVEAAQAALEHNWRKFFDPR